MSTLIRLGVTLVAVAGAVSAVPAIASNQLPCPFRTAPSATANCVLGPGNRVLLDVAQYWRGAKAGQGWAVEIVRGFEEPPVPRTRGSTKPTTASGQTLWEVRAEEIYTVYSWTPRGGKCPPATVFTFEEGEVAHVGMGCGTH